MSAPKFAPLRPPPEARPARWDGWCESCLRRLRVERRDSERHYQTQMLGCGPVRRKAALWGQEWEIVARWASERKQYKEAFLAIYEEGQDLIDNGNKLCEMGDTLEGRARVNAGLSLMGVSECAARTVIHATNLALLREIGRMIERAIENQDTEDSGTHVPGGADA